MTKITVAALQLNTGHDIAKNLHTIEAYVEQAAKLGAHYVATPENAAVIFDRDNSDAYAQLIEEHNIAEFFSDLAARHNVFLLCGGLITKFGEGRFVNRSSLYNPAGDLTASYDKIHLFDVTLPDHTEFQESSYIEAGDDVVIANCGNVKWGMSICYDVRFAHLYRAMAQRGAQIISVPSDFTVPTGKAHWHVLLRARAIETGCFIIAPAQCGSQERYRDRFGHSLIINPWGEIIAQADDNPGIITAELDLSEVVRMRALIPAWADNRAVRFIK
jgi:predicted amidohydrolase